MAFSVISSASAVVHPHQRARPLFHYGLIIPGWSGVAGVRVLYGLGIVAGGLIAWLAYLIFLWRIAQKHGPEALRDVAEAAKAFPGTGFAVKIIRALDQK